MVTEYMTSRKEHTVMVYPANGCIGYDICREMVHGSKKNDVDGQKREEMKEILAVCCTDKGKYYDKLKELGKNVKVIVIDDASRMDSWKKHLKDRHCDVMMICCDPSATREHERQGRTMGEAQEHLAKSMEHAMEMTSHMNCKAVCISTVFCADESKYKTWHHLFKCVEKAGEKHFKGDCSVVFHQMMFEWVRLNREEIRKDNQMSWPVSPNAEACSMSMCDMSCCCIAAICHMMRAMEQQGQPGTSQTGTQTGMAPSGMMGQGQSAMGAGMDASRRYKKYDVTGADMMSPQTMIDMMSRDFNMSINYNQVSNNDWKQMMKDRLSSFEICGFLEVFEMMEDGKLRKCTDECKKLTGKAPERFDRWLKDHQNDFRG